jgi:hypothetical protein
MVIGGKRLTGVPMNRFLKGKRRGSNYEKIADNLKHV